MRREYGVFLLHETLRVCVCDCCGRLLEGAAPHTLFDELVREGCAGEQMGV